ncbi:MAG TPA: hypothetical protein VK507_24000 [Iamia sp.]|nr:hypothetical protein [Iamia sp.]
MPRADFDAVVAQLAAMEARLRAVEHRAAAPPSRPAPPEPPGPQPAIGRRRALVGLAGAAAARAAAAVASSSPAAAANDDPLVLGSSGNTASAATGLAVTGTLRSYGIGVTDNGLAQYSEHAAVLGHAKGQAFGNGVHGLGTGGATGVRANSETGYAIRAVAFAGGGADVQNVSASEPTMRVTNFNETGIGALITAFTQLQLEPDVGGAPPDSGGAGATGQLRWVRNQAFTQSDLWACVDDGNPGTWRKVVGTGTAGAFHLLPTPKRVYDSRTGTTPSQGPKTPLAPLAARTIDLKHNSSGVPAGATGALLTLLLVGAANANGNLTVWANDKSKPASNTMVWGGPAGRFAATAVSALDAQARIKIDASHATDVVIDVVGYYR